MIRLERVSKRYGEVTAVDGLSLEVGRGEVCVLIGRSGCGKTTTLRMINRLIEPSAGRILIDGEDTAGVPPEELRRSIGYAIQSVGLFPHMTVAANIGVVPELLRWGKARVAARTEELLALVGLDPVEYAGKYPSQLSGGEAQRIGVARALAADPPMLLMDEPFGAVDPLTRDRLQAQFLRIQAELKKTVILVTHDLDEAIRLADRIAIMEAGRLVQYDTPEAILSRPAGEFVENFVGGDRALKRLSRLMIADFARPVASVTRDTTVEEARKLCGSCPRVWVVDDAGRLTGWIDADRLGGASSVGSATVSVKADKTALTGAATLREALARMLREGAKSLPVVDAAGRLAGEMTLADIEAITAVSEE